MLFEIKIGWNVFFPRGLYMENFKNFQRKSLQIKAKHSLFTKKKWTTPRAYWARVHDGKINVQIMNFRASPSKKENSAKSLKTKSERTKDGGQRQKNSTTKSRKVPLRWPWQLLMVIINISWRSRWRRFRRGKIFRFSLKEKEIKGRSLGGEKCSHFSLCFFFLVGGLKKKEDSNLRSWLCV